MKKVVLNFNGFEELQDFERNTYEAVEDLELPGEFEGTIRVTIEYIEDEKIE